MKRACFILAFLLPVILYAQEPVHWDFSSTRSGENEYIISLKAQIEPPWHIYSLYQQPGGPLPTMVNFEKMGGATLPDSLQETGHKITAFEPVFNMDVVYFTDSVIFSGRVLRKEKSPAWITGTVEYMVCNAENCMPPATVRFRIKLD